MKNFCPELKSYVLGHLKIKKSGMWWTLQRRLSTASWSLRQAGILSMKSDIYYKSSIPQMAPSAAS